MNLLATIEASLEADYKQMIIDAARTDADSMRRRLADFKSGLVQAIPLDEAMASILCAQPPEA